MNTIRKSILIGLTVIGMSSATLAARADDTTPAPGRHGAAVSQEQMQAKMAEMFAKHQAKVHDLLKLTAAQEGAWTTYQAAIKPVAPATHVDRAAIAKMSSPDRMAKMLEMSKQHIITMEAHLAALTAFYGQLTTAQKTVFDSQTMGGGMHHRHGGWGDRRG
jgi:protein CpxP